MMRPCEYCFCHLHGEIRKQRSPIVQHHRYAYAVHMRRLCMSDVCAARVALY